MRTAPEALKFEITRNQMLSKLASCLDSRVVLLVAPSGYGKTTTLAQYCRSSGRDSIWVGFREHENGGQDVFQRCQKAFLGHLADKQAVVSSGLSLEKQISDLSDQMSEIKENLDIVFDNVQHLNQDGLDCLNTFIRFNEGGHRFLIASYSSQGLNISKLALSGELSVIDDNQLAFDQHEIQRFFGVREVSPGVLSSAQAFQGWPAGLTMLTSSNASVVGIENLIDELLRRLDPAVWAALPELSLFDVWDQQTAQAFSVVVPAMWWKDVYLAGVPGSMSPAGVFSPHRLILDHLRAQLRLNPQRFRQASQQAATFCLGHNNALQAVVLLAGCGLTDQALLHLYPLAERFLRSGERHSLQRLLEVVPFASLDAEWQSRCAFNIYELGEQERGKRLLEALHQSGNMHPVGLAGLAMVLGREEKRAEQHQLALEARQASNDELLAAWWPYIHSLNALGRFDEAERDAQALLHKARERNDRQMLVSALTLLSYVRGHTGDFVAKRDALQEAIALCLGLGFVPRANELQLDLAATQSILGQFEQAELLLAATRKEKAQLTVRLGLESLEAMAKLKLWQGLFLEAKQGFEFALDEAKKHQQHGMVRRLGLYLPNHETTSTPHALVWEAVVARDFKTAIANLQRWLPQVNTFEERFWIHVVLQALQAPQQEKGAFADQAWIGARLVAYIQQHSLLDNQAKAASVGAAPSLALKAIGGFVLTDQDHNRVPLKLTRSADILLWLVVNAEGSRQALVEDIWGDGLDESASEYFRVALRQLRIALRKATGIEDCVPLVGSTYRLHKGVVVNADVLALERATTWQELKPLVDEIVPDSDACWLERFRANHVERLNAIAESLLGRSDAPDPSAAVVVLERLVRLDPLSDRANRALVLAHHRCGASSQAQRSLDAFCQRLRSELQLDLDRRLREEFERLGLKVV